MNYLVISNGFGEDQIACNIITALQKESPAHTFQVIPLVGKGQEYRAIGLTPLIENPTLPSGGFIRSVSDLLNDLKAGLISMHLKQRSCIKKAQQNADHIICVGDFFCLFLGSLGIQKTTTFLPTAKSDLFMPHSSIEKWWIRKKAQHVFTRDALTAASLQKARIPAEFVGNPMFDKLTPKGLPFDRLFSEKFITILPGSRDEAYGNLEKILVIISHLTTTINWSFAIAKAPSLALEKVKTILSQVFTGLTFSQTELGVLAQANETHRPPLSFLITDEFVDAIHSSNAVIGLSGTGNEQAVYMGKTVFTFTGTGPQTTALRFEEQHKLLGEKLIVIPHNATKDIAEALSKKLNQLDNTAYAEPPAPNAAKRIAHLISRNLSRTERL